MIHSLYVKLNDPVYDKVLVARQVNPQTAALHKCCVHYGSKTCRLMSESCCTRRDNGTKQVERRADALQSLVIFCASLLLPVGSGYTLQLSCSSRSRVAVTLWPQFAAWGGGGSEKQADRQVRTQETEAECNRGRTTCHPA